MNADDLKTFTNDFLERCRFLLEAKGKDYTGDTDRFANFRVVETMHLCSAETGIVVRMTDKLSRLSNLIQSGNIAVKDETLYDTLIDMANYSILLAALIEERKTL